MGLQDVTNYLLGFSLALILATFISFCGFLYISCYQVSKSKRTTNNTTRTGTGSKRTTKVVDTQYKLRDTKKKSRFQVCVDSFTVLSSDKKELYVTFFCALVLAFLACLAASSYSIFDADCETIVKIEIALYHTTWFFILHTYLVKARIINKVYGKTWLFHIATIVILCLKVTSAVVEEIGVKIIDEANCLTEFPVASTVLISITNIGYSICLLIAFIFPIYSIRKKIGIKNLQMKRLAHRAMKYTVISVMFSVTSYILIVTGTTSEIGYAIWYIDVAITVSLLIKAVTPPTAQYVKEEQNVSDGNCMGKRISRDECSTEDGLCRSSYNTRSRDDRPDSLRHVYDGDYVHHHHHHYHQQDIDEYVKEGLGDDSTTQFADGAEGILSQSTDDMECAICEVAV